MQLSKGSASVRPTVAPWGWKGPAPGFQGQFWLQWQLSEKTQLCRLDGHPCVVVQPVRKEEIIPWNTECKSSRRVFWWSLDIVWLELSYITHIYEIDMNLYCCCSVTKSCLILCDLMDCSTPGCPVLHYLPESVQTHVHWISDVIQPSHTLSSPSPPAFIYIWIYICMDTKSLQLHPILCDPMDCSPPGSSVHGILQARTLIFIFSLVSTWLDPC